MGNDIFMVRAMNVSSNTMQHIKNFEEEDDAYEMCKCLQACGLTVYLFVGPVGYVGMRKKVFYGHGE